MDIQTYRWTEKKRGSKVTTRELPWVFPVLLWSRNRVDGECRFGRKGKGRGMEQDKARPLPPTTGWTPMPAVWLWRSYLDLRSALTMNFLVLLKQKQNPLSEWSDMENVQSCFFFNSVWNKKANPSCKFFFLFTFLFERSVNWNQKIKNIRIFNLEKLKRCNSVASYLESIKNAF